MPLSFKAYKRIWFLLAALYFAFGYLILNWLNTSRAHYYDFSLSFEEKIPLIPAFILGYLLVYLSMLGLYFLITDKPIFKKVVVSFFLITTIHYLFFILLPVKMGLRPEALQRTGIIDELVRLYYIIDKPYNCFPSLHVAYAFLGTLILWNYKRKWGYIYLAATIIISVSVVLVKQHYILDVAGGYATTALVYILVGGRFFGRLAPSE